MNRCPPGIVINRHFDHRVNRAPDFRQVVMQQGLALCVRVQLTGLNITAGMAITYGEHSGHITVRFVLNALVCGDQHQRTGNRPAAQAAMTF